MAPVGTAAPSLATPQTDCAMVTDPLATPASRLTSRRSAFTVMEVDGALPPVICSLMCTMTEPTSGTVTVTVWFGFPVTFTDWPSTCSPVTVDEPADPDSSEVHRLLITLAVSRLSPVRPMLALATSAELVTVPPLPMLPVVLVLITPTPPMPGRLTLARLSASVPPVPGIVDWGVGGTLTVTAPLRAALMPYALPCTAVTAAKAGAATASATVGTSTPTVRARRAPRRMPPAMSRGAGASRAASMVGIPLG
jgi:hypothetical protein